MSAKPPEMVAAEAAMTALAAITAVPDRDMVVHLLTPKCAEELAAACLLLAKWFYMFLSDVAQSLGKDTEELLQSWALKVAQQVEGLQSP